MGVKKVSREPQLTSEYGVQRIEMDSGLQDHSNFAPGGKVPDASANENNMQVQQSAIDFQPGGVQNLDDENEGGHDETVDPSQIHVEVLYDRTCSHLYVNVIHYYHCVGYLIYTPNEWSTRVVNFHLLRPVCGLFGYHCWDYGR
jgi:hypothetical protein